MLRLAFGMLAVYVAFQYGKQQGMLESQEFFITKSQSDGAGGVIVSYASIQPNGEIIFSNDIMDGTMLDYNTATIFKRTLRAYIPALPLQLEIVNPQLLN